jgi:hypothetical protein
MLLPSLSCGILDCVQAICILVNCELWPAFSAGSVPVIESLYLWQYEPLCLHNTLLILITIVISHCQMGMKFVLISALAVRRYRQFPGTDGYYKIAIRKSLLMEGHFSLMSV